MLHVTMQEGNGICAFGLRVIKVSYCVASSFKETKEAKRWLKDRDSIGYRGLYEPE